MELHYYSCWLNHIYTMTIMSFNRSTWVNGNVVCRSLNFITSTYNTFHMDLYTWELSWCIHFPTRKVFFPFVKLGILSVALRALNSSFILKPWPASIQSPMKTLLKKLDSFVICVYQTLYHPIPKIKNIAPARVIPIKYWSIILLIIWSCLCSLLLGF